ncbi:MAG TPA: cytidylyltransferase [Alphaproteobacteria bacterium]|nr:cytidylyltransferase [Alphaproteobacteria bacterium]
MIVAILIGREGSSGYPGKNVLPVLGKPLVAWPLEAAKSVAEIGRIYVSTDSPSIKAIAREYGARIIERPAHLATKAALGEHAYEHAHQVIAAELAREGQTAELYVLLMANAPTVSAAQLREGIAVLRAHPEYDSAVTVSCYNMWSPLRARKIGADGLLHPFVPFETFGDPKTLNCDRDSQGDSWFADMGVSIVRPKNLDRLEDGLLPQKWMGQKIYPIRNEGGLDVDYPYQMPQAEFWLKAQGGTKGK